jgi:hypothetical protein
MVEPVVAQQSPYAASPHVGVTARPHNDLYYCRGGHWDGQIRDQSGRADAELFMLRLLADNKQAPLLLLGECRVLDAGQRGQGLGKATVCVRTHPVDPGCPTGLGANVASTCRMAASMAAGP